jgi:Cd2+/Zn2+-exporting ATPase
MTDRLRYRVEGMDCGSCARKIETALTRVPGVSDISITTTTETLRLRVAEASTGEQVEKVVRDLGYGIAPVTDETRHHHDHGAEDGPWWRSAKGG